MPRLCWIVAAPFAHEPRLGWVPAEAAALGARLEVAPARYRHDRSRPRSGWREWRDYLGHAVAAWRQAGRADGPGAGVVSWFPQLALCLGLIKRLTFSRRPLVAWCFNLGEAYGGWRGRLARLALAPVDIFVVHSRAEAALYARWLRLPRERFIFVPLSVEVLPEPGAAADEPFVLSMGSARRDYATLAGALATLGLPGVIVAGPHALAGVDLPAGLEVRRNLPIAACHDLARRARVNVLPISNDGTASGQVTLIEAMMLGKAVVATRCPGTEDYVVHGETGLLVQPNDADGLALAIDALWRDAGFRQRLGEAARAQALERFTFRAVAPALVAALDAAERRASAQGQAMPGGSPFADDEARRGDRAR